MAKSSPLPQFKASPVVETVMGVHFKPLTGFNVAARAEFWATLKDHFPAVEERAPVDEVREEFGKGAGTGREIRWQISAAPPSPRLWATSADGRHTVQIQHNALMVNWERDQTIKYLPYPERRRDFAEKLGMLEQFLREMQIGELAATTSFVTYINHIQYSDPSEFAPLLQDMLTVWENKTSDGWLPAVERASLEMAFAMPDEQGRLHVKLHPAVRHKDKGRIIRLDLTARGTPRAGTIDGTLDWIDLGHEWIVRGFTSLTRPEMHHHWERTKCQNS